MSNQTVAFVVPESNFEKLSAKIEKLGRKAVKLGLVPPSLVVWAEIDKPMVKVHESGKYTEIVGFRRYLVVELLGEAPTIPGWTLVAVVEHTTDSDIGNVLRVAPGQVCPVEYRLAAPDCDHCHSHRQRLETFILRDEQGEHKQVGRNCLADWCRSPEAAKNMVSTSEWLAAASDACSEYEDDGGGSGGEMRRGIEDVLNLTARLIRHFGWVSRGASRNYSEASGGMAFKQATADRVAGVLRNKDWRKYATQEEKDAVGDVQDCDATLVDEALKWIRDQRPQVNTLDDYLYNLLVVCSQETLTAKHYGLACSLVGSYLRHKDMLVESRKPKPVSEWVGNVKDKVELPLTLMAKNTFNSQYGLRTMLRFRDDSGRTLIWWAGDVDGYEVEKVYVIKGTIKAHEEYRGIKQTILTRCKMVKEVV